jgi:predicted secreted protein
MFRLLFCIVASVAVGVVCGGWQALKWRSAGDVRRAGWALHRGSLVASLCSIVLLLVFFGWPWKSQNVNALEEFAESVIVPEEGAVAAIESAFAHMSAWWTGSKAVLPTTTKTFTGKRSVSHTESHFSPWLLAFEFLVAAAAYYAQLLACALLWRMTPRWLLTPR